jgi:hypothetical protein
LKVVNPSALSTRFTSQDPSCPEGFLCDQQECPADVICPAGQVCVNFEGTIACGPSDLQWCALNPTTFEGVGCEDGTCWYGLYFFSSSVSDSCRLVNIFIFLLFLYNFFRVR